MLTLYFDALLRIGFIAFRTYQGDSHIELYRAPLNQPASTHRQITLIGGDTGVSRVSSSSSASLDE